MTRITIEIPEGPEHARIVHEIIGMVIAIGGAGAAGVLLRDLPEAPTPPAEERGSWITGADADKLAEARFVRRPESDVAGRPAFAEAPIDGSQAALDRIQAHVDRIAELSGGLAMEQAIESTLARARAEPAGGRKRSAASIRKANQTRARNRAAKEKTG